MAISRHPITLLRLVTEFNIVKAHRVGELSVDLDKAEHKGPGAVLPNGGKYKRDALADAGISTSTPTCRPRSASAA
jgi:hypothetical protein